MSKRKNDHAESRVFLSQENLDIPNKFAGILDQIIWELNLEIGIIFPWSF